MGEGLVRWATLVGGEVRPQALSTAEGAKRLSGPVLGEHRPQIHGLVTQKTVCIATAQRDFMQAPGFFVALLADD